MKKRQGGEGMKKRQGRFDCLNGAMGALMEMGAVIRRSLEGVGNGE
ncbi:MAG: hypothetical protein JXR97_06665 [Planctomycetes bacterium]|nr:hypothetical protein [Planctomycetota bacterium]